MGPTHHRAPALPVGRDEQASRHKLLHKGPPGRRGGHCLPGRVLPGRRPPFAGVQAHQGRKDLLLGCGLLGGAKLLKLRLGPAGQGPGHAPQFFIGPEGQDTLGGAALIEFIQDKFQQGQTLGARLRLR